MANGSFQILEYKSTFAFSVKKYLELSCISKLAFKYSFVSFFKAHQLSASSMHISGELLIRMRETSFSIISTSGSKLFKEQITQMNKCIQ